MKSPKTVVLPLVVINIVVFVLQLFMGRGFTDALLLVPQDVLSRPWIIISSMFLHASPNHIFFNMYGLFIFGPLLEQRIGPKRFLMIYFVSGIVAALGHTVFSSNPALGASGAIMGMLGALIILMPHLKLLLFFFIPMELWQAGILWAIIDFLGVFFPTGIGNIAHLTGMATGLAFGWYLKGKRTSHRRQFSGKTHMDMDDIEEYLRSGRI